MASRGIARDGAGGRERAGGDLHVGSGEEQRRNSDAAGGSLEDGGGGFTGWPETLGLPDPEPARPIPVAAADTDRGRDFDTLAGRDPAGLSAAHIARISAGGVSGNGGFAGFRESVPGG